MERASHKEVDGDDADREAAKLVERFQAGDREAYAGIYKLYADRVYAYLRVALKSRDEAEDVTQQVFTQALEALPHYEERGKPFSAWLFRVARNCALMHLRAESHVEPMDPHELEQLAESAPGEDAPELRALGWIVDGDLLVFIQRLPLAQRQVLALRYLLDLPTAEIARILGRSPEAVRMQHSRALAFLRDRLTAIGRNPDRNEKAPRMQRVTKQATVLRSRRYALFL